MPNDPAIHDQTPQPPPSDARDENGDNVLHDALPAPEASERIDKIIIIGFFVVFLLLFVWFISRGDQPLFAFWAFTAMLTLVLVGALKATGVLRTRWIALGGSAAVYVGLIWFTGKTYDNYYDGEKKLRDSQTLMEKERGELRKQILALQKNLEDYRDQDLVIATFDARHSRPIRTIKFTYVLRTGEGEKTAEKREYRHIIPAKELRQVVAIAIEFDLVDARPERPGAADVSQNIDIERMNFTTLPLQLDLYVRLKEGA